MSRPGESDDDRALILAARRGPAGAEAYGELVRRYQTSVYNVCYRLLGDRAEAEDAAQEAFLRAYGRLHLFDIERPFGPWIRRVAANLCLNRLPSRPPVSLELDDERDTSSGATPSPEALRIQAEGAEAVRAALLALPPRYRAVVELRHFQEMSYAEIAVALKMPLSDVKSCLFRARQRLAEILKHDAAP